MYTHSLWGTSARREHLFNAKKFWCKCKRCEDPTEFGTNFSTIRRDNQMLTQKKPLDPACPWTSKDGSVSVPSSEVFTAMSEIGSELAVLQISKSWFVTIEPLCAYNISNAKEIKGLLIFENAITSASSNNWKLSTNVCWLSYRPKGWVKSL